MITIDLTTPNPARNQVPAAETRSRPGPGQPLDRCPVSPSPCPLCRCSRQRKVLSTGTRPLTSCGIHKPSRRQGRLPRVGSHRTIAAMGRSYMTWVFAPDPRQQ